MTSKIRGRRRASGHREASARITATLATLDFPLRKEDLAERAGDATFEVAPGATMPLREMLSFVDAEEFKDAAQVQDALHEEWQAFRAAVGAQEAPPGDLTEPGESGAHGRHAKG